jgi:hypothetical protein
MAVKRPKQLRKEKRKNDEQAKRRNKQKRKIFCYTEKNRADKIYVMEDKETEKPTETKILIGELKKEMEKEKEKSVERSFLKITHHLFFGERIWEY